MTDSAGFWERALASLVDFALLLAGIAVLLLPTAAGVTWLMLGSSHAEDLVFVERVARWITYAEIVVLGWPYFALLESSSWQATVGKRVLGLHVTDEGGRRLTGGAASRRYFSKLLSGAILGLGFLMAAFSERGEALHDRLTGTRVARVKKHST
jgi:uncharacterized RDD family membrane protein YckC